MADKCSERESAFNSHIDSEDKESINAQLRRVLNAIELLQEKVQDLEEKINKIEKETKTSNLVELSLECVPEITNNVSSNKLDNESIDFSIGANNLSSKSQISTTGLVLGDPKEYQKDNQDFREGQSNEDEQFIVVTNETSSPTEKTSKRSSVGVPELSKGSKDVLGSSEDSQDAKIGSINIKPSLVSSQDDKRSKKRRKKAANFKNNKKLEKKDEKNTQNDSVEGTSLQLSTVGTTNSNNKKITTKYRKSSGEDDSSNENNEVDKNALGSVVTEGSVEATGLPKNEKITQAENNTNEESYEIRNNNLCTFRKEEPIKIESRNDADAIDNALYRSMEELDIENDFDSMPSLESDIEEDEMPSLKADVEEENASVSQQADSHNGENHPPVTNEPETDAEVELNTEQIRNAPESSPEVSEESAVDNKMKTTTIFTHRMSDITNEDSEVGMCANCANLTGHKCANCKQVFYCKKECQKAHWEKGHKDYCLPFKIEFSPELGRYAVATKDIKAGHVIFKDDPLVVGPKQITEPVCLGCYKKVTGNYRCDKCLWPLCGTQCQNSLDHQPECVVGQEIGSPIEIENFDEPNHFYEVVLPLSYNQECGVRNKIVSLTTALAPDIFKYQSLAPPKHMAPLDATRLYQTIALRDPAPHFWLWRALRCLALKKKSKKKYEALLSLESHYEDRKGTLVYKENQKSIVNMLRNYFMLIHFPVDDIDHSEQTIHKVTGIIDVNALELRLPEAEILGIYPNFAMLEHSCTPNTKHTFNDKKQVVIKSAIDIKKGDHLSTMYTHVLWGTLARRDHLKSNKYFMCTCKRCSDPTELGTYFSAFKCEKCYSGYLLSAAPLDELADWMCNSCNFTKPVEEIRDSLLRLGEEVESALAASSTEGLEELITKYCSNKVHPNHFHLFAVKHTLLQMYGREGMELVPEVAKKKEKLCKEFVTICNKLDPGMSRLAPYAGVALYEYHLAVMARLREAADGIVLMKDIDAAKALLQQCLKILQDEPSDQPEGQLRAIAEQNLQELQSMMSGP